MNILRRMQLNDVVICSDYVISGREWSIGGMIHTERSEKKLFQYRSVHHKTRMDWPGIEQSPEPWSVYSMRSEKAFLMVRQDQLATQWPAGQLVGSL